MEWGRLLNSELKEVEFCCSSCTTIRSSSPSQYLLRGIQNKTTHSVSVDKLNQVPNNVDCYQLELPWQQLLTSPYASQCTIHFPIHVNSTQISSNKKLSKP